MCFENPPIDCSIVAVAARSHRTGPGSIPRRAKCIFLVATELAHKSNAAERHSLEHLRTFPGMFGHSPECLRTFPGMFEDIPRNVWRHSPECLRTFPGMFGDIPWNVWWHSPEYNIPPHSSRSPHSVPRPCIPVFIHSLYFSLHQRNTLYKYNLQRKLIIKEIKIDLHFHLHLILILKHPIFFM